MSTRRFIAAPGRAAGPSDAQLVHLWVCRQRRLRDLGVVHDRQTLQERVRRVESHERLDREWKRSASVFTILVRSMYGTRAVVPVVHARMAGAAVVAASDWGRRACGGYVPRSGTSALRWRGYRHSADERARQSHPRGRAPDTASPPGKAGEDVKGDIQHVEENARRRNTSRAHGQTSSNVCRPVAVSRRRRCGTPRVGSSHRRWRRRWQREIGARF